MGDKIVIVVVIIIQTHNNNNSSLSKKVNGPRVIKVVNKIKYKWSQYSNNNSNDYIYEVDL